MTVHRLSPLSVSSDVAAERAEPRASGLMLGENPTGPLVAAPWAGFLVALGARLARYAPQLDRVQLVVAITVPVRDLAAVLVACGWTLTRPANELSVPAEVAATLGYGTPVRMVTDRYVIGGSFYGVEPGATGPRIRAGGTWELEHVHGVVPVPDLAERRYGRRDIRLPGSLACKTGQSSSWAARQCDPRCDLAILGTMSWLAEEMTACVGWGEIGPADEIGGILLPDTDNSPAWATRIYAAQLLQELDMPTDLSIVVLDGPSAIRWLPAVESPIVVVVLDRRTADDVSAETVMQVRARSELVALDTLGWQPPAGVEALAFQVAL